MSVQSEILYYVQQKKRIYDILLSYIEDDGENEEGYQRLIEQIEIQNIGEDVEEIKEFLRLLSCVSNNHVRYMHLIKKIEKILLYFSNTFKYEIFGNNPRIYHFLHKNKIITVTEDIVRLMNADIDLSIFLPYFNKENNPNKSQEIKEKLEIGENDSYLCKIIREDLIGEFVEYISQNSINPSSEIGTSDYETNIFLLQNPKTTLIEYAIFFGAIKIMNYLLQKNAKLNLTSFLYAIHSNNPAVISFLEDNIDDLYYTLLENCNIKKSIFNKKEIDCHDILDESIKCHHNDLTNYLKNIFGVQEIIKIDLNSICISALKYRNYEFSTEKITDFNHACEFGYYNIAFLLLNSEERTEFKFPLDLFGSSFMMNNYRIIELYLSHYSNGIISSFAIYRYKLTQITIPPTITIIDNYAFNKCSLLVQITIPSSVTSIGDFAFSECSLLDHIKIPSSVTSIGHFAFEKCSSLAQITIPSSVTSIGNNAFNGIKKLEIKGDIQSIPNRMFSRCSSLTQITIPSSVTSIGNNAFEGCSSLTQIAIPSSVNSIGKYAFSDCSSLTQISIPSSVENIGKCAFKGCPSLLQTSIPHSLMPNESNLNSKSKRTKNNRKKMPKLSQPPQNDRSKLPRSNWGVNNANNQSNQKVAYEEKGYQSKAKNNTKNNISKATTTKSERKIEYDPKLLNEYEIIHMLNHPNVIKTSGLFYDDQNYPFIGFEDCLTNLNEIVRNKIFSNAQLAYSIYQIAEGMKYIHSQKIMHLNLTPTNILISDDLSVKISGFQNAQKMTSENEIGEIEDVCSFGKIVYFILSGREINEEEQEQVINSFPSLAQQLMEVCLSNNLECKMTFEIICDVLDENNYSIISLSQQEIDELSTMITQYRHQIASYSE